jgi:hypothetical protein
MATTTSFAAASLDAMSYRELQASCRANGAKASGKAVDLKRRLEGMKRKADREPAAVKRQHTTAAQLGPPPPAQASTAVSVRGGATVGVPEAVLLKCRTVVRMREETEDEELQIHLPGIDAAVLAFAVSVLCKDDVAGLTGDLSPIQAAVAEELGAAGSAAMATLSVARAADYLECPQLTTVALRNVVALGGADAVCAAFVIVDESAGTKEEQAAARTRNADNALITSLLPFAATEVLTYTLEAHELYTLCALCSAMHDWGWSQAVLLRRRHAIMPQGVSQEEEATGTLGRISIRNVRSLPYRSSHSPACVRT